jgi:hypothetical protein
VVDEPGCVAQLVDCFRRAMSGLEGMKVDAKWRALMDHQRMIVEIEDMITSEDNRKARP